MTRFLTAPPTRLVFVALLLCLGCSDPDPTKPPPVPPASNLEWSFEGSTSGWTATNWEVSGDRAYLGTRSLRTKSYSTEEDHCGSHFYVYPFCELVLDSGVDLTDCADASFEYWQVLAYESDGGASQPYPPCQWEGPNFDAWIEVSLNGGAWQRVQTYGHSYNRQNWERVTVPLGAFVGPGSRDVKIRLRFRGGATRRITNCWWIIDAVRISKTSSL